jgi:exodeoxyribonuclease V alpha subunit
VSWSERLQGPVAVPSDVAVLAPFVDAGVFGSFEVQLATTMKRLQPDISDQVVVALAVAARAPRFGHVCAELRHLDDQIVELEDSAHLFGDLPWPPLEDWVRALAGSALVASPDAAAERVRPLVWDGRRLYLQRYWHYEVAVATDLARRADPESGPADHRASDGTGPALESALDALFGPDAGQRPDLQRVAARRALTPGVSIIAGGPGTGKTHTVARLLAVAHLVAAAEGGSLNVALAAPTGKAAQRMKDAVRAEVPVLEGSGIITSSMAQALAGTGATTIHRLLGWFPGPRFDRDRRNPLPHSLVIIDETSMVSLPLMARLLDAVRPEARLVLVGDPNQLASIEAGTVLADVVGPAGGSNGHRHAGSALSRRVTVLRRMHRFGADSAIAALAEAVRVGEPDAALELLAGDHADLRWVWDTDLDAVEGVRGLVVDAGI